MRGFNRGRIICRMQKIVGTTLANISEHLIANIQENDEMNDNLHRSLTSSNGLYQKKRKNYREKDYDSRSILSSQNDDDRRERRQNNRFYDQRHKYYERGTNARRRRRRRKERQSYHTNSSDEMISDESGNWHIEKKRTNYPLKPIINSNYRTVNFTDCGDQKRDNFPKKQTSNYNKYYKSKPFTEYAYMSEKTTISSTSSRESQKEKFDKFGTKNCRLFRTCESLMKEKLRSSSPSSSLDNETINSVKLESVRRSTNFLPSSSSSSSPSFSSSSSSSSISLSVQKLKISKSHRPPIIRRKKQSKQLEKSINGSSNVNEQPPVKPRRFPRKLSNNNNNHTDENSDIIESEYSNLSTYSSLETSNINLSDNNSLTTNTSESYIYGLTNENDNSSTDDVINDSDNDHSDIVDKKSEEVEEDYSKCFQRYVMEERWKSFDVNEQETLKRERNSVSNSNYGKETNRNQPNHQNEYVNLSSLSTRTSNVQQLTSTPKFNINPFPCHYPSTTPQSSQLTNDNHFIYSNLPFNSIPQSNYLLHDTMFPITYEARHLATFQLDSTKGLLTPEDGVRKLKLLLKNQGIWPVLCDFTLTKSSIQIRSKEQTIVEQFPFSSISGLTCVKEVVENLEIFLFISAKKDVSEMNIFNPTNDDAIKIIRTLNNLIEGNFNDIHHPNISVDKGMHRISEYPSKMIPVRPIHVPPTIEMNELHSRNNNSKYFGLIPDIAHSANQNVAVADCANTVNIILSEIEIFFARLSENARHRNNGGENSEKPNGMDRLRRKLPSDEEFVNILQKIKYCFNVLSKINSHIDKPNGTEIIHFIFTPLSIIFSVTKREILRNVWTPMLSPEAKSFLYKYLLDNEIDLLETGGPAWSVHTQITKEMLTLVKPNYHPTNSVKLKSTVMTTSSDNSIYTPNESMAKELQMKQVMIDIDNLWNYYKFHNIKFTVNALDNRKADNERELSVKAGEYLKIVDFRPSKHWCCLKNIRGNIGYVPKTIIRFTEKRDYSSDEEDLESIIDFRKKGHKANGRSDAYNNDVSHFNQQLPSVVAQNIQESPDTCRNFDQETDQFSWGRCNLPSNVIQRNISLNENIVLHSSNKNALPKRSMSQNRMINVNSTCDEMRRWMIMKGFSQQFISLFGQLNGRKLFGMSQKQIAECGEGRSFYDETEMNRFQNCVRLQKNISGCHTNTIDSELNHILQQRKKQTEQLTEN